MPCIDFNSHIIIKMEKKGFTLIELLMVISIISLLSSIVISNVNNARVRARDTQRLQNIKQLQTALELYYNDNGRYPSGYGIGVVDPDFKNALKPYISDIMEDPTGDGWGYAVRGINQDGYELAVHFEDTTKYFTLIPSGIGVFLDRCIIAVRYGIGAEWGLGNNPCKNVGGHF